MQIPTNTFSRLREYIKTPLKEIDEAGKVTLLALVVTFAGLVHAALTADTNQAETVTGQAPESQE